MNLKRIAILLLVIGLFLIQLGLIQHAYAASFFKAIDSWRTNVEDFMANLNTYNRILDFIREDRELKSPLSLDPGEIVVLFIVDLILSLFCLWLAIFFMTDMKSTMIQKYLWFIFIWNITWLAQLLVFKGVWGILDFLVIRLRPDLGPVLLDHLPLVLLTVTIFVYIWLLARSFGFNFSGALGVFFGSHLVYFMIIFIIILSATHSLGSNRLYLVGKNNFSIRQVMHNYIMDSQNIAQDQNPLSLIRIKAFHL